MPNPRRVLHAPNAIFLALAAATALGACEGSGPGEVSGPDAPETALPATPAEGVRALFTRTCAFSACHAGPQPQASLDLTPDAFHGSTVGVRAVQAPGLLRVDPGRPDGSYLVLKVEGRAGAVGGIGTQMPLGGQLTAAQIDSVRAWILAGAPDR